jgi:serine/threonine-protein kinase
MRSIIGTVLRERYHINQELSRAGFSITYLAEDRHLPNHPRCIVKRLQPQINTQLLQDNSPIWHDTQKKFVAEAITLHRLGKHEQIPQLLAYFTENQDFYLVEEFIEGETLEEEVNHRCLREVEAIALLQDILKILNFVHEQGVIHRNIQPAHIIRRSRDGKIFLINFGDIKNILLSPEIVNSEPPTKIIKTQGFISPEQQEGVPNVTSDLYALGKTVIYTLAGNLPDKGNLQTLALDISSTVPREGEIAPKLTRISPRFSSILNKMIRPNYQERYQSAAEVLADLEREENFITFPPPFDFTELSEELKPVVQPYKRTFKIPKFIIWIVLALPFLGALIIFIFHNYTNRYKNFVTYFNENYMMDIKYPNTWLAQDLEDPITGDIVVFASPKENNSDLFQEKVFITVEDLSPEIKTIDDYTKITLNRIKNSQEQDNQSYKKSKSKLAGNPARTIIYSRKEGNLNIKQMETFTIKNDRVYIITYSAESAKYSKFFNTVETMVNSFELPE